MSNDVSSGEGRGRGMGGIAYRLGDSGHFDLTESRGAELGSVGCPVGAVYWPTREAGLVAFTFRVVPELNRCAIVSGPCEQWTAPKLDHACGARDRRVDDCAPH